MRKLPIYPTEPLPIGQTAIPLDTDHNCTKCELHKTTRAGDRCVPADGEAGDILVIGEFPSEYEVKSRRPFYSQVGKWLRNLIAAIAPGRAVVYMNAARCRLPNKDAAHEAVEACRGHNAAVYRECSPKVVLLLGSMAGLSFLGETFQPMSVRGGYSFAKNYETGEIIPVWLLPEPSKAMKNRLLARAFEADLRHALTSPTPRNFWNATYEVIETEEDAQLACEVLDRAPYVATDAETSGMLHEPDFRIECLSFSDGTRTFVFPRHSIQRDETRPWIVYALVTYDHTTWNGQYDLVSVHCDPLLRPVVEKTFGLNLFSDARIKRKLYEADTAADLGTAASLVGMGGHKREAHEVLDKICDELRKLALSKNLTPTGKVRKRPTMLHVREDKVPQTWFGYLDEGFAPEKFAYRFMNAEVIHRYNARDALTTWHLEAWANEKLIEDEGLLRIWTDVAQPAMYGYARMRLNGFPVDRGCLEVFKTYLETELAKIKEKIDGFKKDLNPNSPKQVAEYLSSQGIVPKRKTDSGAVSYSASSLEPFIDKHPIVDLILQYHELQKCLGTYATGLISHIHSDGRVHSSFLQDGTGTGRASSADPNLFNQPKGKTARKKILANMLRAAFQAPPNHKIIEVDEGQIEIRTLAHLSKDPSMMDTLNSGVDFHMASAKRFAGAMGKDPEAVTDMDRDNAKTSVFAAAYEIPAQLGFMLSKRLGIGRKEGNELAIAMFKGYVGMRQWMDDEYAKAYERGYTRTQWAGADGRKRPLWNMGRNPKTLADLEREMAASFGGSFEGEDGQAKFDLNEARSSWNTANQGTAADIVTSMLYAVQQWLDENTIDGQLVLHIYDSIMVIVHDDDVEKTVAFMKEFMTRKLLDVPLIVDTKVGQTWNTMKKI